MLAQVKHGIVLIGLSIAFLVVQAQPDDPRQKHYQRNVRPIIMNHCFSCHNGEDNKAGINFDNFFFISSIVREGELFQKIIHEVESRSMPPDIKPALSQAEVDTLSFYLNSYLQAALDEKDPGLIAPRRLNNQEYKYVIQDLLGLVINVDSLFPSDPSGGAGFDNHASVLYMSPLRLERYFEASEFLVEQLYADPIAWRELVPEYSPGLGTYLRNIWFQIRFNRDISLEEPTQKASDILFPFATRAYRGFLSLEEKDRLLQFFQESYRLFEGREDRFDASIKESLKLILISHHFLYRTEYDPEKRGAYPISNFELASRLSFFLWSSLPDEQLLRTAYREDLHNANVLEREVQRMLQDPKAKRMGEQFAIQWLELDKLHNASTQIDQEIFPDFNEALSQLMLKEVELFFNYVLLESKNLLEFIDSDYSFMNETLAQHYGLETVKGPEMRKVHFASSDRGGVLGMAGVLTATSLPTRTSPVLRGKWVLEQILGTPPPPPPPNVPELEASHDSSQSPQSLRTLLERHRADPACHGCHQAMDPIGLGLENFDGIGQWRDCYEEDSIDPSGVLKTGEKFQGPAELRKLLLNQKALFAKNFSVKMLSYALGRSIKFKDTPTVDHLTKTLLSSDFDSQIFILELVKSYPFRYKKSDNKDVVRKTRRS